MMSWLFGKKKHKDSPSDSTEEEQPSRDQSDDFIVIEKRRTSLPPNVGGESTSQSSGLYPFIGGTPTTYPAMSTGNLPKLSQQTDAPHYLSGVPFKLSKELQSNMNNDLDIDGLRISEILSFIERLENQNYDYDFTLEEGVIAEMDSRNDE
ncbi:PREDICTED: uncharacterized protein LOC106747525 isoform X2 [Dinoponera quadriceps]|uniref:Uncharacterized protein LOC106747525 isoform X2 n=1 Tax=Dinoponera quadriceps TaxID=609295 RepID=A0A6P3XQF2_DINQU|nr:PREDICTED: uncharacterized protein LOC106747525 isoform X2 [Dinoponera quadriceps]